MKNSCSVCGKQIYKTKHPKEYTCSKCKQPCCGSCVYSQIDGNNKAITKSLGLIKTCGNCIKESQK